MSEGTQYSGGFVNGRCFVEKALKDGPPLYYNGDFHFQGASLQQRISSREADAGIFSSPSMAMFRIWARLC